MYDELSVYSFPEPRAFASYQLEEDPVPRHQVDKLYNQALTLYRAYRTVTKEYSTKYEHEHQDLLRTIAEQQKTIEKLRFSNNVLQLCVSTLEKKIPKPPPKRKPDPVPEPEEVSTPDPLDVQEIPSNLRPLKIPRTRSIDP
jgi:hypothetical protein